ncbi:copper chaperone CopZ [Sporosarcina sp. ANT_H38]|uniref:copper chaperone CopZ n=1 Tax=Sporosarcina sp. ANT_H38 TaxID=2597358 RepID=UPI0011F10B07|nr:copper chaperone CopZ [Sporosarcina sp. ANT_H38]KAA0948432.1 copper chaperone CopZ [Sporosarcina sp. ANT_H38]
MTETTTLNVTGMTCGHCVKAVEESVGKLVGVNKVKVNLESSSVEIDYQGKKVNLGQITDTIEDQGFDVQQ